MTARLLSLTKQIGVIRVIIATPMIGAISVIIASSAILAPVAALAQAAPLTATHLHKSLDLVCAPVSPPELPSSPLSVTGGTERGRVMFSTGDPVIVSGGSAEGVHVGQQFFVRRVLSGHYGYSSREMDPIRVHTLGWIQIAQVTEHSSVATVVEACDGVIAGDYLELYVDPVAPQPDRTPGGPDFSDPAHVILGDEYRQMGSAGELMIIDRGSDGGLRAGQLLTIFRQTLNGEGPALTLGQATIMTVHPETSLIRVDTSREAIFLGDLVAVHRIK